MGNREWGKAGAVFRQSFTDFPLMVELGKKCPSWSLSRWSGSKGLRFIPACDEGFSLRGDKQRLIYKGRKRSHRFTILTDHSFEYDCILNKEPESNVISLVMEGAEHFDFFRQPDFVQEPFLKGSYAVYKKETLIGEGTGKLCHIHRPEIIDARGRRCWGELSIAGNELRITIPEKWLSEALYPVIVDPTIGTTTVGSQYLWDREPPEPPEPLMFELSIPVNRFLVSETIDGNCTAFVYVNSDDSEAGGRPVLYSDNGNSPLTRRSADEGFIDMRVVAGKPAGWRSAAFRSNASIASGSNIWFGVFCEYYWMPRFDWGAKCYVDWWDHLPGLPNTYPIWNVNYFENFKLSMYFTYSSAQNYVRTLTQGVTLTDNRKLALDYRRLMLQTVKGSSGFGKSILFVRSILEMQGITDTFQQWRAYIRDLYDEAGTIAEVTQQTQYYRTQADTVKVEGIVIRSLLVFVKIITVSFVRDFILRRFLVAREELVLKSCITRDIQLESRIN